ncbi:MAG TPA: adenylate/guanylate cyclase domain-containing protein [Pseudolabrys sp.]|nr:adenylate/guanylate cyclase domain-containing protein [Pseudolabrys sp.]
MANPRVERRLAAILAADVAGYSRLMGADEEGTLAALKAYRREVIDLKLTEHRGRIVRIIGDGLLVEFASVVAAVRWAVEVQRAIGERNSGLPQDKRIEFRMGINAGDIIIDGIDIWGDGVNVAARLEALAEPGGICVSSRVQEDVHGSVEVAFEDIGEQQLKNIARPVRVYRVHLNGATKTAPALQPSHKPSIVVLPFNNMSGDSEQEYFADGMVEEITTALSRTRWLFVIARNSSFTYKGRAVDVKQVGRELGVRYALEGGVRKAADRVRITAQLIDASTGAHLWADRFDGSLEHIFELQDQVTASVVGAIAPRLEQAEVERAKHKPTESLDAYDYFLRGIASLHSWTKESNDEALRLFNKAIELDPDFASAYGMASWCYVRRKGGRWMTDRVQETAEAARLGRRAVELGWDDPVALAWGGFSLAYVVHDVEVGATLIDRALLLNPNLAEAWHFSGWVRIYLGQPEIAIEHLAHAMRLSPVDPLTFVTLMAIAFAHFFAGRYNDASLWAEKALAASPPRLREKAVYHPALLIAAASNALAGRLEEAQNAIAQSRQISPTAHISNLKNQIPLRRPDDLVRYAEGLRKAGLPD